MKCMHCGANWTTGKGIPALGKCPFCGENLSVIIEDGKELSMSTVLCQMVEIYGSDILADRKKCIAIFKDLAPELKDEQQILSAALTSGVGDYFVSCPNSERESNIKKAIHSMDYLSNDAKTMVITSLADAMGWDEELAQRSLQQTIANNQNGNSFSENQIISSTTKIPSSSSYRSANVSTAGNSKSSTSSQATSNINAVVRSFNLNKKLAIIAVSAVVVAFLGYLLLGSGSKDSVNSVPRKQVNSAVKSDNPASTQSSTNASNTVNNTQNNNVIVERQNNSNQNESKYSAKSSVGYPIYLNGNPMYILVDGHMGTACYLNLKGMTSEEYHEDLNSSRTTARKIIAELVYVDNAHQGNTTISSKNKAMFYFDERKGTAGYGKPGDSTYKYFNYNGDRSQTMFINGPAAMAYYAMTTHKWEKFMYGDDFYSRANL